MAAPHAASWHKRARLAAVRPDINVTPLVDVVLVLLIIFMVVTPALQQDVPLDLPGVFHPDPEAENAVDPIKVSMPRAGEYHLDGARYDLDGLVARLIDAHMSEPERRLVLRGDQKLRYSDVRTIMARLQRIGFPGLNFMVGERHGGNAPAADPSAERTEG
jgi:biopolymer transport protein ExbD/biopolymer transport protein TolR